MSAWVYRDLRGRTRVDPRIDNIPLRLKFTHMMSTRGWRVHQIRNGHAHRNEFYGEEAYTAGFTGMCGINLAETVSRGVILGTPERLIEAGGVLCPFCHRCRCATPCKSQCVCSTRCQECHPGTDGRCEFTRRGRRAA